MRDGINTLCDWCDRGLRVVSVTQCIDFNGMVGKMIASVLFAVAQMEQETRRERQRAGIDAAKDRGIYRGRQRGTFKSEPERARELRGRVKTGEIALALGIDKRTVQRYLKACG